MAYSDKEIEMQQLNTVRRLTGWTVLLWLVGFFGIVFAVNAVMVYEALSTLSGVETDSAYQAGRMYEQEVAMAKAQAARQWRVDARLTPSADRVGIDVVAHDAAGQPLAGMKATAVFERPTDRRLDQGVALDEGSAGHFQGSATVGPGQWDVVIELTRQNEQVFRSKNRVVLK